MNEIERLQMHLLLIRRCVGWTAANLGEKIGVTRQTINNLEAGRPGHNLTKTQYLAIRKVLGDEIHQSPDDTDMLRTILEILVDYPEKYCEEDRKKVVAKANMMAPAILAKSSSREDVSKEWVGMMKTGLLLAVGAALLILAPPGGKMLLDKLQSKDT